MAFYFSAFARILDAVCEAEFVKQMFCPGSLLFRASGVQRAYEMCKSLCKECVQFTLCGFVQFTDPVSLLKVLVVN